LLNDISAIMRLNKFILRVMFVLLFALPLMVNAQPGPPAGGTPPCGPPFGPVCPIDGGVSLLVAAGLAFGGKKAYDAGRKKA
jgi:hypothetical protein